ncbi:unnamed protein product [Parascedosporium putredinis]|uniref:Dicer-like protein 2 n=1 Tax=Parascedosporium putredinis TaxID=1442378 RepID=A0A9P1MBI7_9PEZI|nr:unnamed protein product [Parascedosporium putredinis]CAI7999635.1 unnamed protein product [Parascedosporium putredinis]
MLGDVQPPFSNGGANLGDNGSPTSLSTSSEQTGDSPLEEAKTLLRVDGEPAAVDALSPELELEEDLSSKATIMAPRAYQLEMFSESMKRNVIVVQIWFLAPTVSLCQQQFGVLTSQIPAVLIKVVTGEDNIQSWSTERVWGAFLKNVKIVVATYQVLFDALAHAFVRMGSVALIVFDEAHNCVKNHPGAKIMKAYHMEKQSGSHVPHILGLTASPSITSKEKDLVALEQTLDAVCKSPTLHRDELLGRVKRPKLTPILYTVCQPAMSDGGFPQVLRRLINAYEGMVMGVWATEYFIDKCARGFLATLRDRASELEGWKLEERGALAKILQSITADSEPFQDPSDDRLTGKTLALLRQLYSRQENTVGIVFAEERIKIPLLAHLISIHPLTRARFRPGTMVGASTYSQRKRNLLDLWQQGRKPAEDLQRFRTGKLDLLIATSVLEEGIDVPACNLVVCFDSPKNLKSFVQRRGRARKKDSDLILLIEDTSRYAKDWESLEEGLRRVYEAEDRERAENARLEEEDEEYDLSEFTLTSKIGATIDINNAKSHLEHFCRVLSPREFVDSRPDFVFEKFFINGIPFFSVEVVLPIYIPACAYKALYNAGFINEHLLPLQEAHEGQPQDLNPLVEVGNLLRPWAMVAGAWGKETIAQHAVTLRDDEGTSRAEYLMTLPNLIPPPSRITLYPDDCHGAWTVEIGPAMPRQNHDDEIDHTLTFLHAAFYHRFPWSKDFKRHIICFRSASTMDALNIHKLACRGFDDKDSATREGRRLIRDQGHHPFTFRALLSACRFWPHASCIIHELEVQLLAAILSTETELAHVKISDVQLVREAISTPSAGEPFHYERLEFLGDSILKWCATLNVAALYFLCILLPDLAWSDARLCYEKLFDHADADVILPPTLKPVEGLIGYTFRKKSLLIEALTHASYMSASTTARSLERLEFIGDSVLDQIIVSKAFSYSQQLPHWKMHRLKTALVNGDFQAFLLMEREVRQETVNVGSEGELETCTFVQPLWAFMRHSSPYIADEQEAARLNHASLREDINRELASGSTYPWALLSRLQMRKFFSDLFESLLGAVWVDSGSLETCEEFLRKFGLMDYFNRILEKDIHLTHPKEEIGSLAGNNKVDYEMGTELGEGESRWYWCKVAVGGVLKAEVNDGVSREEVKTKAAELAVKAMKAERKCEQEGQQTAQDDVDGMDLDPRED